jgi:outer membrane immunogenic protein
MRRFQCALLAAVAVFGFASISSAADLPVKAPISTKAPMAPQAYSWTGFYAGLNAGGVWGRSDAVLSVDPAVFGAPAVFNAAGTGRVSPSGFIGGGQVGYNLQFNNFVVGLETDIDYTNLNGSRVGPTPGITNQVVQNFKSEWLATVRGRAGYAFDRLLVYGTGGLAIANVSVSETFGVIPGFISSSSSNQTKTGWTAGGGVEWAFASSWSMKAEYLYVDLGTVSSGAATGGTIAPNPLTIARYKVIEEIGRVGINYRF